MTSQSVTNDEIMETLSKFADSVDKRFQSIDKRFESIDKRFVSIDKRFDSQEKFNLQLTKRLDSLEREIGLTREEMATKEDIRRLEGLVDGYAAKLDNYAAEMAAMQHKIDRLERMIDYLAEKAGISKQTLEAL